MAEHRDDPVLQDLRRHPARDPELRAGPEYGQRSCFQVTKGSIQIELNYIVTNPGF